MKVVDANVLLYAVNSAAPQHEESLRWLDGALDGEDTVGFGWNALLAFVRISTNPRIMPSAFAPAVAMAQVHDWISAPSAHVLSPGERHPEILERLLAERGSAANLVSDAHLAALAIEHRGSIVSYDSDFARFSGVRWATPTSLLS